MIDKDSQRIVFFAQFAQMPQIYISALAAACQTIGSPSVQMQSVQGAQHRIMFCYAADYLRIGAQRQACDNQI